MPARIVALADAVASAIAARFPDETVTRSYLDEAELSEITGRMIYVHPGPWAEVEPATREQKWRDFTIEVVIRDRHTAAGTLPDSWVDDRMAFVEEVWAFAGDERDAALGEAIGDAIPNATEVTVPYEPDYLRDFKVFQAEFTVTYRELK
ncbi:hypothetical protein [Zavarzinella formosa]|uniref:hypothetical protein n=1 Tax=Zavarzinella formosa TaxID=360055 RepID=UPI0002DC1212|nr:hypothetical protein [Zavarzinella formosa]